MNKPIPDIIKKIDERQYYETFTRKLIDSLQQNLDKTNVGTTTDSVYHLKKSFSYRLLFDSNRHIKQISISHKFFGLFIDLGVGRGVKLHDIGYQKIGRSLLGRKVKGRRAKRWYLKTIYGQTVRLMNLVAKQRGDEFTILLQHSLQNTHINIRL